MRVLSFSSPDSTRLFALRVWNRRENFELGGSPRESRGLAPCPPLERVCVRVCVHRRMCMDKRKCDGRSSLEEGKRTVVCGGFVCVFRVHACACSHCRTLTNDLLCFTHTRCVMCAKHASLHTTWTHTTYPHTQDDKHTLFRTQPANKATHTHTTQTAHSHATQWQEQQMPPTPPLSFAEQFWREIQRSQQHGRARGKR